MQDQPRPSLWPGRLAKGTWFFSIPLVVFGGLVTTMRAGMAEDGWLRPEGTWLWLMPWERRVSSAGLFVEHHHREFGTIVGLLAIGTVLAAWLLRAGGRNVRIAAIGLTAIVLQGLLGGTRVLDNSPELAFLHGVAAQGVVGVLAWAAMALTYRAEEHSVPGPARQAQPFQWTGALTLALAVQVTLGAWYRHGHGHTAIALHGFQAILVVWLAVRSKRALKAAAAHEAMPEAMATHLRKAAKYMTAMVHLQWVLGGIALWALFAVSGGMRSDKISDSEIVFSTLHVLSGALLVSSVANALLWSRRVKSAS
ncbi:MAG: hypothetical protein R3E96_17010 [Planctomycetota bacterium]